MLNKQEKLSIIIAVMRSHSRFALLLSILPLAVTACSFENVSYCLESSDSMDYVSGHTYQVTREDIVTTFYLINPPEGEEGKHSIEWNKTVSLSHFTVSGGLSGKTIFSIAYVNSYVVRIKMDGKCTDAEATFGYIKVNPDAYKRLDNDVIDRSFLAAYVAIGSSSSLIVKPDTNQNE